MENPYETCRSWCQLQLGNRVGMTRDKMQQLSTREARTYNDIVRTITNRGVACSLNDHGPIVADIKASIIRHRYGTSMIASLFAPLVLELLTLLIPLVLEWLKSQLLLTTADDVRDLNDAMREGAMNA